MDRVWHFLNEMDACVWMGPDGHNTLPDGIYELSSRIWWQSTHQFGCYFEKATHHERTTRTSSEIHWGKRKRNLTRWLAMLLLMLAGMVLSIETCQAFQHRHLHQKCLDQSESHVCRLSSCEIWKESNYNLGWSHVGAREGMTAIAAWGRKVILNLHAHIQQLILRVLLAIAYVTRELCTRFWWCLICLSYHRHNSKVASSTGLLCRDSWPEFDLRRKLLLLPLKSGSR